MTKRILFVDHDPDVRRMVGRLLSREDYHLFMVAKETEALKLAATAQPDLVLLDLTPAHESRWETFERLTREQPLLPVIAITARSNQLFTATAASAGSLVERPIDLAKLLQTIKELMEEPVETRLARAAARGRAFRYSPRLSSRTHALHATCGSAASTN